MLVIGRLEGESVWIGDVRVQIVKDGKRVRLGIHAAPEVPIERDELRRQRIAEGRPLSKSIAQQMATK